MKVMQAFLKKALLETEQFSWEEESDLIKDFHLSQEVSEVYTSEKKKQNNLSAGTKVTFYCTRKSDYVVTSIQTKGLFFVQMLKGFFQLK